MGRRELGRRSDSHVDGGRAIEVVLLDGLRLLDNCCVRVLSRLLFSLDCRCDTAKAGLCVRLEISAHCDACHNGDIRVRMLGSNRCDDRDSEHATTTTAWERPYTSADTGCCVGFVWTKLWMRRKDGGVDGMRGRW